MSATPSIACAPCPQPAAARNNNLEALDGGFEVAQPWDPSMPCCNPIARANELAKAAQSS